MITALEAIESIMNKNREGENLHMSSAHQTDSSTRKLFRYIARLCRRQTLVLVYKDHHFVNVIKDRHKDTVVSGFNAIGDLAERTYDTVVISELIENLVEDIGNGIVSKAWDIVKPDGQLIVIVPNEDCIQHPNHVRQFNRRGLKNLLKPFGVPKLAKGQPFKWLVMYVKKLPDIERPRIGRSKKNRFRVIERLCKGNVIELGCGVGHLTGMIRNHGFEVMGVDISVEKIHRARKHYPDIEFIRRDILDLSLPSETFDTVILAEVLEHVDENAGTEIMLKAWRLLRPKGRLIVSVPNEDCIPHHHHVRQFDRNGLKKLMHQFGNPMLVTDQPFKWIMMYVDKLSSET